MRIGKQCVKQGATDYGDWKDVPVPASIRSIKDFSRYMAVIIGRAGDVEAKNMRYFLNRGQTYSIQDNGYFWVFSK